MSKISRSQLKSRRQQQNSAQRRTALIAILAGVGVLALIIITSVIYQAYQNNQPVTDIKAAENPVFPTSRLGTAFGDPNAPVQIDVYIDFQCPACRDFTNSTEAQIFTDMKDLIDSGQVYYHVKMFPFLDQGTATQESHQSANAAMCADEQGKFWEMHNSLFANWNSENAGAFSPRRLKAMAESINLDMTAWQSCFDANKYRSEIDKDYSEGKNRGVSGTPSVYINGVAQNPGFIPSYEEIKAKVDSLLVK